MLAQPNAIKALSWKNVKSIQSVNEQDKSEDKPNDLQDLSAKEHGDHIKDDGQDKG
jgi:hypothetical protein